jgi:hypothetical protein
MVRIYVGRDPETRKRRYIGKSIHGGLRTAQAHLKRMLAERDLGQYLDHWLDICARLRLRAKSFRDYSTLLARYVRPRLGARPLGELSPAKKLFLEGLQLFMGLIMNEGMSFAFETVFSHWDKLVDGTSRSKLQTCAGVLRQLTLVARK